MAAPKPFIIETDLSWFRDEQICPACKSCLSNTRPPPGKKEVKWYAEYHVKSAERFGDKSLPLCWHCYRSNTEKCHGCDLPIYLAFSSELGAILMRSTTMAVDPSGFCDHLCTVCRMEGKTPDE